MQNKKTSANKDSDNNNNSTTITIKNLELYSEMSLVIIESEI